MISTEAALARVLALCAPVGTEEVPLAAAAGRVLAEEVQARRSQPPFDASAMDGYALRDADARAGATLAVIGEAAAGRGYGGRVGAGEAVRIFTGAPVPAGADRVVLQEDARRDGNRVTLTAPPGPSRHIRAAGGDFAAGDRVTAPRRLGPAEIALLAAMNIPVLPLRRRPVVALIPTGDELVAPGEDPGPDQIVASNSYGLNAMLAAEGAEIRMLPIARDNHTALSTVLDMAEGADLIVTIGGASVGDHDLVRQVAGEAGLALDFYKVAMRPGKPLMAGRLRGTPMVGLPGNPVSAMVCGHIFLRPAIRAMLGLPAGALPRIWVRLTAGLGANGGREHYARARLEDGETGPEVTVFDRQDSALLSVLSAANALAIRPPDDPARAAGELIEVIRL